MQTNDFFKAGGTLHPNAPSYVVRAADELLFRQVAAGHLCYVLTTRQMGKSSLMMHTVARLNKAGVRTAIIDLSSFGVQSTSEQWYLAILTQLTTDLSLTIAVTAWWQAHRRLGVVQCFMDFINEVVLAQTTGRVVIFFDEIDATRRLPFTDDFFAVLRAVYNERAMNVDYARLTFVLLGVAAPTSLIKDPNRTPFNIGKAIDLQEFTRTDAYQLENRLEQDYPGRGATLLDLIFDWTNGHPYLTQKLCVALADVAHKQGQSQRSPEKVCPISPGVRPKERSRQNVSGPLDRADVDLVDAWVERLFLDKDAKNEQNLHFVRSRMLAHADIRALLALYARIYRSETVSADERSPLQNELKLIGLIAIKNGTLGIRNEIYRHVFNQCWIDACAAIQPEPSTALVPVRSLSRKTLLHHWARAFGKRWRKIWFFVALTLFRATNFS